MPDYYIVRLSSSTVDCLPWEYFQKQAELQAIEVTNFDEIPIERVERKEKIPLMEMMLCVFVTVFTMIFLICTQRWNSNLKNKYKILLGIEPKHPVVITTKVIPLGSNAPECEDGDDESVEFGEEWRYWNAKYLCLSVIHIQLSTILAPSQLSQFSNSVPNVNIPTRIQAQPQ